MIRRTLLAFSALALVSACATATAPVETAPAVVAEAAPAEPAPPPPIVPVSIDAPAGVYQLERNHAGITARVNHLGLSSYPMHLPRFDMALNFDPANPTAAKIAVAIDAREVVTTYRGDYKATHKDSPFKTWDQQLAMDERFLNAKAHPEVFFQSTGITLTGPNTGTMTGDLTFLGVTKPVTLQVSYVGTLKEHPFAKVPAIGFSATGAFKRTDFGMTYGVPFIGDDVTLQIDAEFLKADDAADAAAAAPKPAPVRSGKVLRDLVRG